MSSGRRWHATRHDLLGEDATNGVCLHRKGFNFILGAHVAHYGQAERFHLFARCEHDPTKWPKVKWIDLYTGEEVVVSTEPVPFRPHHAEVMTYRRLLERYRFKAEPKKADQEGQPCSG